MSRIGNLPCVVPKGVLIDIKEDKVLIKGPLGELSQSLPQEKTFDLLLKEDELLVIRKGEDKKHKSQQGLFRSLLNNHIKGVCNLFSRTLELVGVGYRASSLGPHQLELSLGYSHNIVCKLPSEVFCEVKTEKGSNPIIILKSSDIQLLGMVASYIKSLRPVEPYKGKGIRELGEIVRRKDGKKA